MITFHELLADRSLVSAAKPTAEVSYYVTCAAEDSDADIVAAAENQLPAIYAGLPRLSTALTARLSDTQAMVTMSYGTDLAGLSSFSFEIGTASEHIMRSLATVAAYGPGASSIEAGNINFDGETVQGLDIEVPIYEFSETHQFRDDQITPAYKATIYTLTAKVNVTPYKGYAAGELLFRGCSGSKVGNDLWSLTYRFAASPNVAGLYVGAIGPIAKAGWDYLWISYARTIDNNTNRFVPKPVAVYVEQVYHRAELSQLGI